MRRSDTNENYVTIQTLVTEFASKSVVEDFRNRVLQDFAGDTSGSIVNDKIVYVLLFLQSKVQNFDCILKLGENANDLMECPFEYLIYEKKYVIVVVVL